MEEQEILRKSIECINDRLANLTASLESRLNDVSIPATSNYPLNWETLDSIRADQLIKYEIKLLVNANDNIDRVIAALTKLKV